MAKPVITLRVEIEGLGDENLVVHERDMGLEIPTNRVGSTLYVDISLMKENLLQQVAANLREIADDIEAE